jgi:uncharacterized metal-binding protein YceD (DUF177 family)
MTDKPSEPEFSRPFDVGTLGSDTVALSHEAGPAERVALARRFGLKDLPALKADFRIRRGPGAEVEVEGRLAARATQTCVVSLEPVEAVIDEAFALVYAPPSDERGPEADDIDPDAADPPEPILAGKIDLGEAAAEQLSLSLDPYPRKPGAAFDAEAMGVADGGRPSPFAALAALKPKDK